MADNEIEIVVTSEDGTDRTWQGVATRAKALGHKLIDAFAKVNTDVGKQFDAMQAKATRRLEDIGGRKLKIDADTLRAEARIEKLRKKLEEVGDEKAKIQINADIKAAEAGLALIRRRAGDLDREHVKVKVEIDKARAERAAQETISIFRRLADVASGVGSSIASALAGGAATTTATGGTNMLAGALTALATAAAIAATGMVALAPAVLIAGGAMGAAATAAVGLGGAFGVLKLGLGGIGDAWTAYGQQSASGGGSAASAARQAAAAQRQVEHATDALTEAQRDAKRAQDDVTKARQAEAERLDDLSRKLAGARLDEEGALLAVQRAEEDLAKTRSDKGSSVLDIREAELAYRQAVLRVQDMRDSVDDLSKEQDKANRVGIEGSDQVQAALERQRQANRRVEQATKALADAQAAMGQSAGGAAGGVDKFAEAMAALSPNARKLVGALIDLKPRFDDLKKSVQDKLLAGADVAIKDLAGKWLPALDGMLGRLAGRFNALGKTLFESLGRPEFIRNISTAMDGFGRVVSRLGGAIAGPLVDAFGRLAAGSVPFLEKIGDLLAGAIEKFSAWIKSADQSGALESFMRDAAKSLQDIWDIGGLAFKIIGQIIDILFPSSKRASDSAFSGAKEGLQSISDALADPKIQKSIKDWADRLAEFIDVLITEVIPTILTWTDRIAGWISRIGDFINTVASFPDIISRAWSKMVSSTKRAWSSVVATISGSSRAIGRGISTAIRGSLGAISTALGAVRSRIVGYFRTAGTWLRNAGRAIVSGLIGGIRSAAGTIGAAVRAVVPDSVERFLPGFQHGGISGGGPAWMNERGPELVRLPSGSMVYSAEQSQAMASAAGGGGKLELLVGLAPGVEAGLAAALLRTLRFEIRRGGGVTRTLEA